MGYVLRALLAAGALGWPAWSRAQAPPAPAPALLTLSRSDRLVGGQAAVLAGRRPLAARRWLQTQRVVRAVHLGRDGKTLDLHFMDGREVVILPAAPTQVRVATPLIPRPRPRVVGRVTQARRAVVLEPFATQLDLGASAGQYEASVLTNAGFAVDIFRDSQVTVPLLESLANYSAIYFQTHSGLLENGDAIVVTGETDDKPYEGLYKDRSLIQAFVAGDPKKTLYNSFTANFVNHHMGTFPTNSFMFLNGCATLSAYTLMAALHSKNLATVIGWDNPLFATTNAASGTYIMARLALGETIASAVSDARIEGIGTSIVGGKVSRLGYDGDGSVSLAAANLGGKPSPTPMPTATSTPTATPSTPRSNPRSKHRCKRGYHRVNKTCKRIKKQKHRMVALPSLTQTHRLQARAM